VPGLNKRDMEINRQKGDASDHQVLLRVYQLVLFGMQIDVR